VTLSPLPIRRVCILVAGNTLPSIAERRGDFDRWIRERTGERWPGTWSLCDVRKPGPLPGPRAADAFVMTGSASSVTEAAPWMLRAQALLRAIARARVPLLGICFGHQMIAQALGGEVKKSPFGREIGTVRVRRTGDDPLFAGLPRTFDVHATHVDAVVKLPPGAELLATTPRDPHASFRIGDRVRAVQFHPEFDADVMRGYVRARAQLIRAEGGDAGVLLDGVHDGVRGRDILWNFARMAARAAVGGRPGYLATAHLRQSSVAPIPHDAQPSSPSCR
jgi:GMP synthase (glutamine-hydrolysing)